MMRRNKVLALAGITLLSGLALAACGGKSSSSTAQDTPQSYSYVYTEDPVSLDYILNNRAQVSDIVTNMVDGLFENDQYGNLIPALAEDWTVSKDGLTYTYKLREGVKWYTVDGEEYGEVTADDFVAAIEHAVKGESEALYIIQDSIKGLDDYVNGKTKDFKSVGVKAVDDYTLEYTLAKPETYWNSKLTMAIMLPVNREFLESQGDDFGKASPDGILYNGAYFIAGMTSKSSIEYVKNENYWDADNVHVDEVKLTYYDGNDPESLVKGFKDGNYNSARVFPNLSSYASVKKEYGENIVYSNQGSSTYWFNFNLNRTSFENSKKDEKQKEDTKKAVLNKDFRQAIAFAIDRSAYTAQNVGEDAKDKPLRSLMVPSDFVSVDGESFDTVVEEKVVKLGDEWKDVDFADGQDSLYNPEKALEQFEIAKEALTAEGVTFPVQLDYVIDKSNATGVNQVQSFKQSVEASLGKENVVINVVQLNDEDMQTAYYAESASQADYDILYGGWGPDYQDPSTYLDIFNPEIGQSLTKIGIDPGKNTDIVKEVGLDKYQALLEKANAETSDVAKRYELYAEAQAWMTDSAISIPYQSTGASPNLTKVKPFSASYSALGIKGGGSFFKYLEVVDEPVTTKEYDAARDEWTEAKAKSNAEAEKALADHVEEK